MDESQAQWHYWRRYPDARAPGAVSPVRLPRLSSPLVGNPLTVAMSDLVFSKHARYSCNRQRGDNEVDRDHSFYYKGQTLARGSYQRI